MEQDEHFAAGLLGPDALPAAAFGAVGAEERQQRRLRLAALAIELLPLARGNAAVRRDGWIFGLDRLDAAGLQARLHGELGGDAAPALRRAVEPTRWAAAWARAGALGAAWFDAGVRIFSAPELCDERNALAPLTDATPAAIWLHADAPTWTQLWRRQRVAVLHSRKPRELTSALPWVRATVAALAALPADGAVIGAGGELPAQLVRAAALQAGRAWIEVGAGPLAVAVALRESAAAAGGVQTGTGADDPPAAVTISALWPDAALHATGGSATARRERRDALLLALAHRAWALALRAGGNWQRRLMQAGAGASAGASAAATAVAAAATLELRARIAVLDPDAWGLTDRGGAALLKAGCARLELALPPRGADPTPNGALEDDGAGDGAGANSGRTGDFAPVTWPVLRPPTSVHDWPYLIHWTRRPDGPWPDEPPLEWLGRVVRGAVPHVPDAGDALLRILTQRRIVGARQFLRAGPAVCLTELPPERLFGPGGLGGRLHRGLRRPRYEPWGIGLRRDYLLEKGAAPAIYGDEAVWEELDWEERFRFQAEGDRAGGWAQEGEWRLAGDLDFSDAEAEDWFVAVPTAVAAAALHAARAPDAPRILLSGV
ncbi:MAG: hypothetical protein ACREJ2_17650 [Planctomycetota bacterium]